MPTDRQLETFLTAATENSFRRTAELLGVSQPSVSKQIKALEAAVGGELFSRKRGASARLTPLGESVLQDARRMVRLRNRLTAHNLSSPEDVEATIFLRHFLLDTLKPRLAELIARGLPQSTKFVVVDDSNEMLMRVQKTKNSFGLLRTGQTYAKLGVQNIIIREDNCSLYASPELAKSVNNGDIPPKDVPILLYSKGLEMNEWIMDTLDAAGVKPAQLVYGPQFIENLLDSIIEGNGAAIFIDSHATSLVRSGELARINIPIRSLFYTLLANANVQTARFSNFVEIFRSV